MTDESQKRKEGAESRERRPAIGIALAIGMIAVTTGAYLAIGGARSSAAHSGATCAMLPRALGTLRQKLLVEAFITPNENTAEVEARLRPIFAEIAAAGAGLVEAKVTRVTDEATRSRAQKSGAQEQGFAHLTADAGKAIVPVRAFSSIAITYGMEQGTVPFVDPRQKDGLALLVLSEIRAVVARGDRRIARVGLLTGDDELRLSSRELTPAGMSRVSLQEIVGRTFPYFTLVDVDLHGGETAVEESVLGLVVTQPGRDLTDKELRRIDEMVMKGKSLALFVGAANVAAGDAKMGTTLAMHGIDKLLAGYGIEIRPDVVFDPGSPWLLQKSGADAMPFPQVVLMQPHAGKDAAGAADDFAPLAVERALGFPLPSSVVLHPEKQPSAKLRAVAHTSPKAMRHLQGLSDPPVAIDEPTGAPVDIAATLEGTVRSAFGAGTSARPVRILVVASSEFVVNPFARALNLPPGAQPRIIDNVEDLRSAASQYAQHESSAIILSFKATLDWMTPDDPWSACVSTLPPPPPTH